MPRTPSSSTRRRRPSTAPTQSGPAAPTASGIRRCAASSAASASPAPVGRKPCFPSGIPYRRDPPRDSFGEEKKRPTPPRYQPRQYPVRAVPTTTYGEQQAAAEERQANAVGGGFQPMGVRVAPVAEGFADIDLDRGGYDGRTPSVAPQPAAPSADAERYEKLSELYDTLNANNRHLRSIFARLPGSGFPPPPWRGARARTPRGAQVCTLQSCHNPVGVVDTSTHTLRMFNQAFGDLCPALSKDRQIYESFSRDSCDALCELMSKKNKAPFEVRGPPLRAPLSRSNSFVGVHPDHARRAAAVLDARLPRVRLLHHPPQRGLPGPAAGVGGRVAGRAGWRRRQGRRRRRSLWIERVRVVRGDNPGFQADRELPGDGRRGGDAGARAVAARPRGGVTARPR